MYCAVTRNSERWKKASEAPYAPRRQCLNVGGQGGWAKKSVGVGAPMVLRVGSAAGRGGRDILKAKFRIGATHGETGERASCRPQPPTMPNAEDVTRA